MNGLRSRNIDVPLEFSQGYCYILVFRWRGSKEAASSNQSKAAQLK